MTESRKHLANNIKGVFIQSPPGSGKSVVIAEIIRLAQLKGGNVWFIAHREELLDNIKETLTANDVDVERVQIMSPQRFKNRLGIIRAPT